MKVRPYACFAGTELFNDARSAAYVSSLGGVPGVTMSTDCPCAAYDDGNYVSPLVDGASWVESTRPESYEFYGLYAFDVRLDSVWGRTVTQKSGGGGTLGPLRAKPRAITVQGYMIASSEQGQEYGQAWLETALLGSPCGEGGCGTDELLYLPACPPETGYDASSYAFRTLLDVGLIDGPVFSPAGGAPEWYVQQVGFQLLAGVPGRFHPPTNLFNATPITGTLADTFTTPNWMGDGTLVIEIENIDNVATTDIVITGQISLDGSCPVGLPGSGVMPSFVYTIPTLGPEDRIVIDGRRGTQSYYDASTHVARAGLSYIDYDGPFKNPTLGPCTTLCLTITSSGGDAVATVDGYLRE